MTKRLSRPALQGTAQDRATVRQMAEKYGLTEESLPVLEEWAATYGVVLVEAVFGGTTPADALNQRLQQMRTAQDAPDASPDDLDLLGQDGRLLQALGLIPALWLPLSTNLVVVSPDLRLAVYDEDADRFTMTPGTLRHPATLEQLVGVLVEVLEANDGFTGPDELTRPLLESDDALTRGLGLRLCRRLCDARSDNTPERQEVLEDVLLTVPSTPSHLPAAARRALSDLLYEVLLHHLGLHHGADLFWLDTLEARTGQDEMRADLAQVLAAWSVQHGVLLPTRFAGEVWEEMRAYGTTGQFGSGRREQDLG